MLASAAGLLSLLPLAASAEFAAPRDIVVRSPHAVVVADFDRDTKLDIAFPNALHHTVTVVINGGGSQTISVGSFPTDLAVGDFNADLVPDLAATNSGSGTVSVALGRGDGTFEPAQHFGTGAQPILIAVADFNGDLAHDLAIGNYQSQSLSVLLGNGDGTFQSGLAVPLAGAPSALVTGDFDRDLNADVALAVGRHVIAVLRGTGLGTFLPALDTDLNATWLTDLTTGDFNGDGNLDLAAADPLRTDLFVLTGDGQGAFPTVEVLGTHHSYRSLAVGDVNEDSKLDLVAAVWRGSSDGAVVFIGNGDGTFQAGSRVLVGGGAYSVAVGDLDGDQNLDVVTTGLRASDEGQFPHRTFPVGTMSVRFGNGDGTFRQLVARDVGGRMSIPRTADLDGDQRADLAVIISGPSSCGLVVALGAAGGGFQVLPVLPMPPNTCGSFSVGDFDGDAELDLVAVTVSGVLTLFGNGDGTFTTGPTSGVSSFDIAMMEAGQYDSDGNLDLVWFGRDSSFNTVLLLQRGNGDGTFQPPTEVLRGEHRIETFAVVDFDGDSHLDVAVGTWGPAPLTLLAGNGDGTFQSPIDVATGVGASDRPSAVVAGDLNGDGRSEVVVANSNSGSVSVLSTENDGTLRPPVSYFTPYAPSAVAVADVTRDQTPDLVVLNANMISVLRGNGDGTVSLQPTGFTAIGDARPHLLVADFTSDGHADVMVRDRNQRDVALLVNVAPGAAWPSTARTRLELIPAR